LPAKLFRLVFGALCALMLAVTPSFGGAADPYEIYSIQAMTGGLSFVGKTGSDALQAYEEYFNKTGGINGRPIHFVLQDAQMNPRSQFNSRTNSARNTYRSSWVRRRPPSAMPSTHWRKRVR
jgi:hypothetical protein